MKGNLLIIDDEKALTDNLKVILSKFAENVFISHSGADGLKILAEKKIHCVVCDIYMPEMSGLEVIKIVRDSGNQVPFIFFTAFGVEKLREEVSSFDRTLFLVKPNIEGIVQIIEKMIQLGLSDASSNIP